MEFDGLITLRSFNMAMEHENYDDVQLLNSSVSLPEGNRHDRNRDIGCYMHIIQYQY